MEWKKLLYGCVGLFAACALAGCGKEEEENLQYLNLSDIACTFTGEDNLPFKVTVYAYATGRRSRTLRGRRSATKRRNLSR